MIYSVCDLDLGLLDHILIVLFRHVMRDHPNETRIFVHIKCHPQFVFLGILQIGLQFFLKKHVGKWIVIEPVDLYPTHILIEVHCFE